MQTNEHGQQVGDPLAGWTPRPMPARVKLRGRYVSAEPIAATYAAALFDAVCGPADDALWTYRPGPRPTTLAEFERSVVEVLSDRSDGVTFAFLPTGGSAAGLATLFPCVPASGVVEISGVLWGRAMQRSTAATEAIHLLLRYVFEELGYRRVEWKCDSLNEPSRRAAARLGFSYEGRFRHHMVTHGRNRDTDWFSMLNAEWPTIRTRHERWLDPANFDGDGRQRARLGEL